jgi:superfamily II RNA helicase
LLKNAKQTASFLQMSIPANLDRIAFDYLPPSSAGSDAVLEAFLNFVEARNVVLYPAQEEAVLELFAGKHVVLNTPTGSGKSLVALAMHFRALALGRRSFYTAPIKALVSEKFFHLCREFGAANVGMLTGDASINRDAPIVCCTAEILANLALSDGEHADIGDVIMDEFHYYADKERGVAWQLPLLLMKRTTFLLMSATLGDVSALAEKLSSNTGKPVVVVSSRDRPVPLDFTYSENPIHETLATLVAERRYPVYVVNFTQRECAEQAQNALSVNITTKDEKAKIVEALADFRFDTPYGKVIKRTLLHGVGMHHAGLLPKYRLLVEKLAQDGLLKIIMGTDTLGVGVNIPIRTVLFTKLCKFDGVKTGILSVRDFKQIAGRAGRKGFDEAGSVVCQAPEHVIENKRQEARFSTNEKAKKKIVRKGPPEKNFVMWDEKTFKRLIESEPETLSSQFVVHHGMMLNLLESEPSLPEQGYKKLVQLIDSSDETSRRKSHWRKASSHLFHGLKVAHIVEVRPPPARPRLVLGRGLQTDFSLFHTLSLYLVEALPFLDATSPMHMFDVLSLVESVLEEPRVILMRQVDVAKSKRMAELRMEGADYEQRIEELEKIEHPKPLADFIYGTFAAFREKHPWVEATNIHPKSIAREICERGMTFNEYVKEYGLERSEGVLLRYMSQAYKALAQTVPDYLKNDAVYELENALRVFVARVDKSLIEEWERMVHPDMLANAAAAGLDLSSARALAAGAEPAYDPDLDMKGFTMAVRAQMQALVCSLAAREYEEAAAMLKPFDVSGVKWDAAALEAAMVPFYEQHTHIVTDPRMRQPHLLHLTKVATREWSVSQVLLDSDEHNDFAIEGRIVLSGSEDKDAPLVSLLRIGV